MRYLVILFSLLLGQLTSLSARAGVLEGLASPVTTPANIPFYVGVGLTGLLIIFEDQIVDPTQEEIVDRRPLGKFSKLGDYSGRVIPNGLYFAGMLAAGALGSKDGYESAKLMFLATAYSTGVSTILKYAVREPRPNDGSDRKSFPSGHATAAFSFASVVGARNGWGWGIPAYGLATLVAVSRMNDNKHYVHDVVAGATIGIAYGLGVTYLAKRESSLSFAPLYDGQRKAISVSYRF
jgi:membrane-associated phospholipid phosphatase